jgi:hypothetical protein
VTANVPDYEKARLDRRHTFYRHLGEVSGQMVKAVEHFLSSPDAEARALGSVHDLRTAPDSP